MDSRINLRFIFLIPFIFLILSGLTVPSDGDHGLISIKGVSFVASVFGLGAYLLINNQLSTIQVKFLLFLIVASMALIFWFFVSSFYDATTIKSMFDQFKIFWITLCTLGLSIFFVKEGFLSFPTFIKMILYFNLSYSLLKVGAVILFLIGLINIEDALKLIGVRYMSMSIYGDLSRLQTSVDIMTPFLSIFILQSDYLGLSFSRKFKVFYIVISLISIFLSFSRYLLFIEVCGFIFYWCTLRLRHVFKYFGYAIIGMMLITFWVGPSTMYSIVETRFFSTASRDSDTVRSEQVTALMAEFREAPCLGNGLGSYSTECIRDYVNPHAYEVQWVAFLMQFGIAGVFLMLLAMGIIVIKYLTFPISRLKISFLLMFILWILSGFTNPFLISLTSGIVYSLFLLTGDYLNENPLQNCKM
ncbi:MAG: hypothetical protein H0W88_01470 [Parachlamydiaceae bacterium]|nr:hypothetical protein [Parachlamydiaceae bacterium]